MPHLRSFPAYAFPSEIAPYRPPHATNNTSIKKITSCDDMIAALSSNGEVFTFTLPSPAEYEANSKGKQRAVVQPQRVWALRKQFSAVKVCKTYVFTHVRQLTDCYTQDVALGSDGSIIICTESGHVFVRSRNLKSGQRGAGAPGKTFKFQRIPYIQRVVRVCANSTGAYGALRIDSRPESIHVAGRTIAQDLADVQPFMAVIGDRKACQGSARSSGPLSLYDDLDVQDDDAGAQTSNAKAQKPSASKSIDETRVDAPAYESDGEENEDADIQHDITQLKRLLSLLGRGQLSEDVPLKHGADLLVQVKPSCEIPVHRAVLAARCTVLHDILHNGKSLQRRGSTIEITHGSATALPRLIFSGCQIMSVLILLVYIYSDNVLSLWDRRVGSSLESQLIRLKIKPANVKADLVTLAQVLELPLLADVLTVSTKRAPVLSMAKDMSRLFQRSQEGLLGVRTKGSTKNPLAHDVVLQLADKEIFAHSVVLRARSPLFAAFFDDGDWTTRRWTENGTIVVNLKHMKWRVMDYVLRFMCEGEDASMFDVLGAFCAIYTTLSWLIMYHREHPFGRRFGGLHV